MRNFMLLAWAVLAFSQVASAFKVDEERIARDAQAAEEWREKFPDQYKCFEARWNRLDQNAKTINEKEALIKGEDRRQRKLAEEYPNWSRMTPICLRATDLIGEHWDDSFETYQNPWENKAITGCGSNQDEAKEVFSKNCRESRVSDQICTDHVSSSTLLNPSDFCEMERLNNSWRGWFLEY